MREGLTTNLIPRKQASKHNVLKVSSSDENARITQHPDGFWKEGNWEKKEEKKKNEEEEKKKKNCEEEEK